MDPSPLALAQSLLRCPSVTPAGGRRARLHRRRPEGGGLRRCIGRCSPSPARRTWRTSTPATARASPSCCSPATRTWCRRAIAGRWRHDPFSGRIENGELFGRGAVDMKGGIACMMAAALGFIRERSGFRRAPSPSSSPATRRAPAVNGTVKLLDWAKTRGERFDHCILGEPTNPNRLGDMIKIGRRGSLTGRITVEGKQGHVAYPHLAENPIPGLMRLLGAAAGGAPRPGHRAFRRLEPAR